MQTKTPRFQLAHLGSERRCGQRSVGMELMTECPERREEQALTFVALAVSAHLVGL